MAYSATLANERKLLSDEEHKRLLSLFSRAGLSMDHEGFDEDMLDKATKAILKTRDGLLRAAVPNPIGTCVFLNDVSPEEMNKALRRHKELMKEYPRQGAGIDAFVDASDTGYTTNDKPVEDAMHESKEMMNGMSNGKVNGEAKGEAAGFPQGLANGYENGYKN
jgi:3-dehydroquinate synthase